MTTKFIKRENGLISSASDNPRNGNESIETTSEEFIAFKERTGDYDKRTQQEKRVAKFPSLGDMIDAICKKNAGDSTEYDALEADRQAVKAEFPLS